jgi:hypothetical protein
MQLHLQLFLITSECAVISDLIKKPESFAIIPPMSNHRDHAHGVMPSWFGVFLIVIGMLSSFTLFAQGVPTVQQSQFRSQWVGEQLDQLLTQGIISPFTGLGAIVGSLQTQDQVQRETEAALANPVKSSPFSFKPAVGVGWQINNQGLLSTNTVVTNGPKGPSTNSVSSYRTGSSPFISPSVAFLYTRDHGPWTISAGYSAGLQYFANPDFVGNGTGSQRNPLNMTAMFSSSLEMSRYSLDSAITAASGNGFNVGTGGNDTQTTVNATVGSKYQLSSHSAMDLRAGYNLQNASQSSNTPNNNITSFFANLSPVYDLSDKTHLSTIIGIGANGQSLQAGTQTPGSTNSLTSQQNQTRTFAQVLEKVKYEFSGKFTFDVSAGARYVAENGITNATDKGLSPAWGIGFTYTPTPKVTTSLSAGVQGADVTPGVNYILNYQPREKTTLSLTASQSQNFAQNVSGQYLVSQSIMGTITQKLFNTSYDADPMAKVGNAGLSDVTLNITGGYTHQSYKNLSTSASTQNTSQLPQTFAILQGSLVWKIREWVSLVNQVNYNGGQTQSGQGVYGNNQKAQMWYSVSLNFAL